MTALTQTLIQPIQFLQRDARHFQILYLGIFLTYGLLALGWEADWMKYTAILGTCVGTQMIFEFFTRKHYSSWKSALITGLGLCLLLKANSLSTLVLAAALAIASKFILKIKKKHLFNPANFGIIAAILLTGDAWVSPGQWGSNAILFFMIGVLGCIVLLNVGRMDTSLSFLVAFAGAQFVWNVLYKDWPLDFFFHQLTNGTLMLFAFFMITDPKTTPDASKARIVWAALIGFISFLLAESLLPVDSVQLHSAPVWTLFFIVPLTALLDHFVKGKRFEW